MKKSRKLILVRNDLVVEAAKIIAKEGRTLFSFTNEVFEWAIEAYRMNVTPEESLEFYRMMKIGKNLGYVVVPSDVFCEMTKELYNTRRDQLIAKWYESGIWNGNYLTMKFHKQDPIAVLRKFMKASLWNVDEFSIDAYEEKISVKCFSPKLTLESTKMLAKFLEGIFFSLGYTLKDSRLLRGMIMLELERRKDEHIKSKIILETKN